MNQPVGQTDIEHDVVGDQTSRRPYLDTEEVARSQDLPMRLEERRPPHMLAALRGGLDAIVAKDIGHGPAPYPVPHIRQSILYARVSSPRILFSHPHDEFTDLAHDAGTARTTTVIEVPLLRDELPMPSHQRIRIDDRVEFEKRIAPDSLRLPRKQGTLCIREPDALPRSRSFNIWFSA